MTPEARAQFLQKIESLDLEIGDALADENLPHLVALAGKASLVAAAALLYQQPPAPMTCAFCDKPADPELPGDFDICPDCFNEISTPDPGLDDAWAEYADELTEALCSP